MTVIAYRDGVLAADSGCWRGNILVGHTRKIRRMPNGDLFAAAGGSAFNDAVFEWLASDGVKPKPLDDPSDFAGIIVRYHCQATPLVDYIAGDLLRCRAPEAPFHAIGAHHEFLMGAMAAGASAQKAVELAIEWGDAADGTVQSERGLDG